MTLPSDPHPTFPAPRCALPVMGYADRRVQLVARNLLPARSAAPFFDVEHVLDHWATMPADVDHPVPDSVFGEHRRRLLNTVAASGEVFLSSGGGLLAYRCGGPLRWHVRHAESGATVVRFAGTDALHTWWTRLSAEPGLDFASATARTYVQALEGLADARGAQIDWTAPARLVHAALRAWQDHDEHGLLPHPGSGNRFGGVNGLHVAAVLHAVAVGGDPLRDASRRPVRGVVDRISGHYDRMTVRGRPAHVLLHHLRRLDFDYNHGRLRPRRDRDWRTRQDLRDDRTTGRVVTLARLLTVGGRPHQAVTLLLDRADAVAHTDTRRQDGPYSGMLRSAARMIADLFSPAQLQIERLRHAQPGQRIVEGDPRRPIDEPAVDLWRVTRSAHDRRTGSARHARYDLEVYDERNGRNATLQVRLDDPHPILIHHANGGRPHQLPALGGHWALLDPTHRAPITHGEAVGLAATAAAAFEEDRTETA